MSNKKLARRYAQALVALGKEANSLSVMSESLHNFASALHTDGGMLYNNMSNPAISIEEKKSVLSQIAGHIHAHAYITNTLMILLERDRLGIFSELVSSFENMADSELSRVRAVVKTASEISDTEKASLRSTLSKAHAIAEENLLIDFQIDPALIGGLIAKVGDKTYDGSVRSQLKDIQHILQ